ncbi:MAG: polysaccharide pyruvyl transferase family protein [Acidobacteria bacterium]|nr:polysaccharide pyruvyl transferase family protein [Acidobacteriota bacterium]
MRPVRSLAPVAVRRRFRRGLRRALNGIDTATVVCWGTGSLAALVADALPGRVTYFVDSDPRRQGVRFGETRVEAPSALARETQGPVLVLIASMYEQQIHEQLASMRLPPGSAIVAVAPILEAARPAPWRRWSVRRSAVRAERPREQKILLVGGYGAGNIGDEAQLRCVLEEMRRRCPDFIIEVLTPTPLRTHREHGRCQVSPAPRVAFYDLGTSQLYALSTSAARLRFLLRSWWLLLHAWLVRANVPFALVRPRRMALLHELSTARLVLFVGGGYLTGSTLSRLWDGMFLMRIASVLGVPVALSGQTIGVWNSRFTRRLAAKGLGCADLIATRDADGSAVAVAALSLRRPRTLSTCDDALFMKADIAEDALRAALDASGIDPDVLRTRYVVLNAHFWGVDATERARLLETLQAMLGRLRACGVPAVIGIPMLQSDRDALLALEAMGADGWFRMLRVDEHVDVIRGLIARAHVCVSMKHHPIIFALGEAVPAVSLTRGTYYRQKNEGALALVGMAHCSVDLESQTAVADFDCVYRSTARNREAIAAQIRSALPGLAKRRRAFFDDVESLARAGLLLRSSQSAAARETLP